MSFDITTIYMVCAGFGGAVLVIQFLFAAFGIDGEDIEEPDIEHDSSWFFGMLSMKSLIAGLAFFGLGGLAAGALGSPLLLGIPFGLGAALAAMVTISWVMSLLHSLKSEGNVNIYNAVGVTGSVYLSIPGERSGMGKVMLNVQDRTVEYRAMTSGAQLSTGTPVVVTEVVSPDTVAVEPVGKLAGEG